MQTRAPKCEIVLMRVSSFPQARARRQYKHEGPGTHEKEPQNDNMHRNACGPRAATNQPPPR
eukprot:4513609-Alexandrium_andersonii.AAC.1